jgi:hypothetical protein
MGEKNGISAVRRYPMPSWGLATALEMSRGTNTKLRTAEGHNQSSYYKGTKAAAQMRTVGRGANNMALE